MIAASELILNPNGSIYHLNLLPNQIAKNIITVGDPDRVETITKHFDSIEFTDHKREFKTQTGLYKGKRITVISTGIGTDNIDIVLNELDALVNIDFETRKIKEELTSLNIIRIGTSGAILPTIAVDSFLISEYAIGLDAMLNAYDCTAVLETELETKFITQTNWNSNKGKPYAVAANKALVNHFKDDKIINGCTLTAGGFYGPQSRVLRLKVQDALFFDKVQKLNHNGINVTNLEMETAGIYGLGKLLGHKCISLNAILANRANGVFSTKAEETISELVLFALSKIITL